MPGSAPVALVVVALANLVLLVRVSVFSAVVAPAILPTLLPVLGGALAAGAVVVAFIYVRAERGTRLAMPAARNPAEIGIALRFGAFFALVLFVAAWLQDEIGSRGLYLATALSGLADVDSGALTALNLFGEGRVSSLTAVAAIAVAIATNMLFKLGILAWLGKGLFWRTLVPFGAALAGGAAGFLLVAA
jgi:uncharacterized membrane protein (DUF4010 family)